MGITERLRQHMEQVVRTVLEPGEQLAVLALASIGPRLWVHLLLGPIATTFLERPHYVAVTDRRLLVLKPSLTGHQTRLVWAEPRDTVRVLDFRSRFGTSLRLRRVRDGAVIHLSFARTWRDQAGAIRAALAV